MAESRQPNPPATTSNESQRRESFCSSPVPRRPRLTLYQALIRPNRFEWLIEKVTELGVTAIVPLVPFLYVLTGNDFI